MINVNELPLKGLCETCVDREACPVKDILQEHRNNMEVLGANYQTSNPDLWGDYAIDEPKHIGNKITWCPLYFEIDNEGD